MAISGLNSLYSTVSGIFGGSSNSVNSASTASASSTGQITDSQQFSPAAMMLNLLQQLQQSNPAQFQQVTATILADYHVELNDALQGKVTRSPNIPGTHDEPAIQTPPPNPQG